MDDGTVQSLLPALLTTNKNIAESDKLHTQQHIQLMKLIRKTMMTPEWSTLLLSLNDRLNSHDNMDDTMKVLIDTLGSLRDHMGDITTIVNESLDRDAAQQQAIAQMTKTILESHAEQQQAMAQMTKNILKSHTEQQQSMTQMTQAIEHVSDSFIENTARLDTLTLAVQVVTNDDILDDMYQKIRDVASTDK